MSAQMVGSGGEKDAVPETPFSESANHFKAALQEVASMGEARVIIVGSGFAGVTLAGDLNRRAALGIEVVVISSENHMVFTPMPAEVAGRSLSGLDVVMPGRQIAHRATWLTATVTSVDLNENEVDYTRPDGRTATLSYAHLVLACGSDINLDHKHDEASETESVLEEIYYFEVADGPVGPGIAYQRVYGHPGKEIDVLAEVRSGDVVLIPFGWHGPSIAVPGYDLYYLNVMAGPGDERAWRICDDPAHGWVRDTWTDQAVDPRLPFGTSNRGEVR